MRRIHGLHLDYPFAGSRMLRSTVANEGITIGRTHVRTLMHRMGVEARRCGRQHGRDAAWRGLSRFDPRFCLSSSRQGASILGAMKSQGNPL